MKWRLIAAYYNPLQEIPPDERRGESGELVVNPRQDLYEQQTACFKGAAKVSRGFKRIRIPSLRLRPSYYYTGLRPKCLSDLFLNCVGLKKAIEELNKIFGRPSEVAFS